MMELDRVRLAHGEASRLHREHLAMVALLRDSVLAARAVGCTWTAIGAVIGVTRSRAQQIAHPRPLHCTAVE